MMLLDTNPSRVIEQGVEQERPVSSLPLKSDSPAGRSEQSAARSSIPIEASPSSKPVDAQPSLVITPADRATLDAIAAQLEDANITEAKRAELLDLVASMVDRYACDDKMCD